MVLRVLITWAHSFCLIQRTQMCSPPMSRLTKDPTASGRRMDGKLTTSRFLKCWKGILGPLSGLYVYICLYAYVCIHTHICIYVYTSRYVCVYMRVHTHTHIHIYVFLRKNGQTSQAANHSDVKAVKNHGEKTLPACWSLLLTGTCIRTAAAAGTGSRG